MSDGLDHLDAQLVNYPRSFLETGLALSTASYHVGDDPDHVQAAGALIRALSERQPLIDREAILTTMVALAGLLAGRERATPRAVFEERFKNAPSDAEWHRMMTAALERRPAASPCPRCAAETVHRDDCPRCGFSYTLDALGDEQPPWGGDQ